MSYAHMLSRMKLDGNSIRQSKINDAKRLMEDQLKTDPSYNEYFVIWEYDVDADDFVEQPIKLYNRKYSSANGSNRIQYNITNDYAGRLLTFRVTDWADKVRLRNE